jgi:hypothetical protein
MSRNFFITDASGKQVSGVTVNPSSDRLCVEVHPPAAGYEKGKSFTLNISSNVQSSSESSCPAAFACSFQQVPSNVRPDL